MEVNTSCIRLQKPINADCIAKHDEYAILPYNKANSSTGTCVVWRKAYEEINESDVVTFGLTWDQEHVQQSSLQVCHCRYEGSVHL